MCEPKYHFEFVFDDFSIDRDGYMLSDNEHRVNVGTEEDFTSVNMANVLFVDVTQL